MLLHTTAGWHSRGRLWFPTGGDLHVSAHQAAVFGVHRAGRAGLCRPQRRVLLPRARPLPPVQRGRVYRAPQGQARSCYCAADVVWVVWNGRPMLLNEEDVVAARQVLPGVQGARLGPEELGLLLGGSAPVVNEHDRLGGGGRGKTGGCCRHSVLWMLFFFISRTSRPSTGPSSVALSAATSVLTDE